MKSVLFLTMLFFFSLMIVACGTNEQEDTTKGSTQSLGQEETEDSEQPLNEEEKQDRVEVEQDDKTQYDSEIEEIRAEGRQELGVENIFIPEMEKLKIGNAFVSYNTQTGESLQLDVQYYTYREERQDHFENEIVVEEYKEDNGMKFLTPPYAEHDDLQFWFIFKKAEVPTMINNEEDGIEEAWIELAGEEVLFAFNGTEYRYYIEDDEGYYMFGYHPNRYSDKEAEQLTSEFIKKLD
ncbi:hypothetical protein [Aquibacillus sediminis]|uniref:hypothetical protein n=1 Tax=Aquibacillus sediminis TaxID=2574734 RepID=UPI00110874EA|nr:hypothetical protein [Aquibacillus sediminis]